MGNTATEPSFCTCFHMGPVITLERLSKAALMGSCLPLTWPSLAHPGVEVGKDQEFSVSTKGAGGQGRLEAVITSPANKAVPCVVEPQHGKDSSLIKYIPKEEGFYSLDLSYDGSPIPGSPFLVEATLPPDPSKVTCFFTWGVTLL